MLPKPTKDDLDFYLRTISINKAKNRANVKHHGGTDMSEVLDQQAVYAMNRHHNPNNEYFERRYMSHPVNDKVNEARKEAQEELNQRASQNEFGTEDGWRTHHRETN